MPFPDSLWSPQVDLGIFNQADANGQITPFVEQIHTFYVTKLHLKKDRIICICILHDDAQLLFVNMQDFSDFQVKMHGDMVCVRARYDDYLTFSIVKLGYL